MGSSIKHITIQAGQTLADIAIQEYGTVEGMVLIMQANPGLGVTDALVPGSDLLIMGEVTVNLVQELVKTEPYASQLQSLLVQWAKLVFANNTNPGIAIETDPIFGAWLATDPLSQIVSSFLQLTDTPASYAGKSGNIPQVNPGETGLDFAGTILAKFTYLSDVPASYVGQELKMLQVKADATGLQFATVPVLHLTTTGTSGAATLTGATLNIPQYAGGGGVDTTAWHLDGDTTGVKKTLGSIDDFDFGIITNNIERVTVLKNGNVGIGTSLASQKLDIQGGIAIAPSNKIGSGGAAWGGSVGQSNSSLELYNSINGNTTLWNSGNFSLIFGVNNSEVMRLRAGNVGIGTTAPSQKLDVAGNININTNGTNVLISSYKGANSNGLNSFIGGGGQNSIGEVGATYKGSYNTAQGVSTLQNNTTGFNNSAQGVSALQNNTTGYNNSAHGVFALQNNTTGYQNSAQGYAAGRSIIDGNSNTFVGFYAGFNASQKTDAVNSMALGNGAYTTADNQVVIGNASVNVGIAQTTATARLHLPAGAATAGAAPFKLTAGTNLTTPENGAFEFDGTNLYFTLGGVRKTVTLT